MDIELELTYLLKYIPKDLTEHPFVEYLDIYIPETDEHPHLRIRKRGDKVEITKKVPIEGKDSSEQYEHTISLNEGEYQALAALPGKRVRKIRYFYPVNNLTCEIDIFQDDLEGLTEADFEFKTKEEKERFTPPDFCLVEVTQDKEAAGGVLAGKKYSDLEEFLERKNYKKLLLNS